MIESIGVYHIGIPVDDIVRAENFYTKILGMKVADRIGESGARLTRLKCGAADVVLFSVPVRSSATRFTKMASLTRHLKWRRTHLMRQ